MAAQGTAVLSRAQKEQKTCNYTRKKFHRYVAEAFSSDSALAACKLDHCAHACTENWKLTAIPTKIHSCETTNKLWKRHDSKTEYKVILKLLQLEHGLLWLRHWAILLHRVSLQCIALRHSTHKQRPRPNQHSGVQDIQSDGAATCGRHGCISSGLRHPSTTLRTLPIPNVQACGIKEATASIKSQ
jgi:hypothetical protein